MGRNVKCVKLNKDIEIQCITITDIYRNTKWYQINVVIYSLPWEESLEFYDKIQTSEEANELYKELVKKYKGFII